MSATYVFYIPRLDEFYIAEVGIEIMTSWYVRGFDFNTEIICLGEL